MVEITKKYQKLIQDRYYELKDELYLAITDKKIHKLLLPQTIQGNITEGHGPFKGQAIPEIEMQDIYFALGFNPQEMREQRTKLCYEPFGCIDALFDGTRNQLVNKKGKPLFRVEFFQDYPLEVDRDLFQAGVKIGRMDSAYWRKRTTQQYPTTLEGELYDNGRGAEHLVNKTALKELGLTPLALSRQAHSEEDIEKYTKQGLFVSDEQADDPDVENLFVRYNEGLGICDDLAISTVRALHGGSGARLGLTIDAMDTYGKWITSAVNGGIDEFLAEYITQKWEEKYGEKLVSDEECMELIYLASKCNIKVSPFSSSHRRFIQKEPGSKDYTFLEHMRFVETGKYRPNFRLGFHRTPSKQFYENLRTRFDKYGIGHLIPPGKEKIPKSKKEKKVKLKTPKGKSTHISDLENHEFYVEQIAQNPGLIGLENIIGKPEKEKPFYYEGVDKKGDPLLAGEADLFFKTPEGYVVVEYKGRSCRQNTLKARNQLIKAQRYLPHNSNHITLLYVSGTDFETRRLEKVLISKGYHNRNNYVWKKSK